MLLEKLAPFEKFQWGRKEEARQRGGIMEKLFEKVGRELYSLHQLCLLQHNALRFMIVKVCAIELQPFK